MSKRQHRKSLSDPGPLSVNYYNLDPSKHYKWVADIDNNLYNNIQKGYEKVTEKDIAKKADGQGSLISITRGGVTSYLMSMPKESYDEYMEGHFEEVDEKARKLSTVGPDIGSTLLDGKAKVTKQII